MPAFPKILAALSTVALAAGLAVTVAAPASANDAVGHILSQTNQYRANAGAGKLAVKSEVSAVAQKHSATMLAKRNMYHNPKYASQMPQKGLQGWAENVGYACGYGGQLENAKAIMKGWWNSAGHKKNLINKSYTHIGIGVAYDKESDCVYATQNFGAYAKAESKPKETAKPTATAKPKETAKPQATPTPKAAPKETAKPKATTEATPKPTPKATSSDKAEPSASATPTPQPSYFPSGTGTLVAEQEGGSTYHTHGRVGTPQGRATYLVTHTDADGDKQLITVPRLWMIP